MQTAQLLLASSGVLILLVGLHRLASLSLSGTEMLLGVLLVFILAMQFLLAALVLPGATCFAWRHRPRSE